MEKIVNEEFCLELGARALQLRIDSIRSTTSSKSGHPTTAMSSADIISVLFFHSMQFDITNPKNKTNDRFILSKGHGIPVVYAAYKQLGVISDEELMTLRDFDSPLEGHPTPRFIYNEAATGSLGQGLAIGAGMAINAKLENLSYKTYVMLGDGELAEGSIWEAAEFASYYKLSNLIGIVDCNRLGQTGQTLYGHDVEQYSKKFEAFGWNTVVVDGHDIPLLIDAIDSAKTSQTKPTIIIAKTYKGYGVDAFQDKNGFHGKPVKKDQLEDVLEKLRSNFSLEQEYLQNNKLVVQKLSQIDINKVDINKIEKEKINTKKSFSLDITKDPNTKLFDKNESLATRKAFGYGLAALGRISKDVVVCDADVKNSTFTQFFEDEFPDRFFQCFIAEQTLIGVSTGLESRDKISFASTFGAFFTRAHDQIRMAGIGRNALRLCGSHCGVSIGEDGPSQMALEDLAMMRSIPNSVVIYPSDAISAYKLTGAMAEYCDGVSYMRTTRAATPMLYDKSEEFTLGGSKILRQGDEDKICIVAAGITLHEALKANDILKAQGVNISVIDAYSVKPLDVKTIRSVAKKSGNKILVVEDHYQEGGLGEAVCHALVNDDINISVLAVKTISRSGTPQKLLAYAGIDAASIVEFILNHLFDQKV